MREPSIEARIKTIAPVPPAARADVARPETVSPELLYERHLEFVWRNARRMGVHEADLEDVVQDVFVIVHRRFGEFESRSSAQTWLFGILLHVVQHYRRSKARWLRKLEALVHFDATPPGDSLPPQQPLDLMTRREQSALLQQLLDALDDDKKAVFLLVELEQKTVPEVAAALGVNVNTVYSRLRAARQKLEKTLVRWKAREKGERT